jgi:hypothetical protein
MAASDVFTPELLYKLGRWSAAAFRGVKPETIAAALHGHGVGVIDLDRQRCLVDERVYESVLGREHLLRAEIAELKKALAIAADQFAFYAAEHRTKAGQAADEGRGADAHAAIDKANVNARLADLCRALLPKPTDDLSKEHLVPVAHGGPDRIENLALDKLRRRRR